MLKHRGERRGATLGLLPWRARTGLSEQAPGGVAGISSAVALEVFPPNKMAVEPSRNPG